MQPNLKSLTPFEGTYTELLFTIRTRRHQKAMLYYTTPYRDLADYLIDLRNSHPLDTWLLMLACSQEGKKLGYSLYLR